MRGRDRAPRAARAVREQRELGILIYKNIKELSGARLYSSLPTLRFHVLLGAGATSASPSDQPYAALTVVLLLSGVVTICIESTLHVLLLGHLPRTSELTVCNLHSQNAMKSCSLPIML